MYICPLLPPEPGVLQRDCAGLTLVVLLPRVATNLVRRLCERGKSGGLLSSHPCPRCRDKAVLGVPWWQLLPRGRP